MTTKAATRESEIKELTGQINTKTDRLTQIGYELSDPDKIDQIGALLSEQQVLKQEIKILRGQRASLEKEQAANTLQETMGTYNAALAEGNRLNKELRDARDKLNHFRNRVYLGMMKDPDRLQKELLPLETKVAELVVLKEVQDIRIRIADRDRLKADHV